MMKQGRISVREPSVLSSQADHDVRMPEEMVAGGG